MRYRVKTYGIYLNGNTVIVQVNVPITLTTISGTNNLDDASKRKVTEAIRLIADETVGEVFCSSMQKSRIYNIYGSNYGWDCGIAFQIPAGKTVSSTDAFTIEMDWGDEPTGLSGGDDAHNLASFFNITEATEYTALTPAEAIAIARDCQYNVMGTDWPIPTWLPTGVTEAQVESAAEGLGIPYHEPTQTA